MRYFALALAALAAGACDLPNEPNLNNPNVGDFAVITSLSQLQAYATGVLRGDRVQNEQEIEEGETIGRDAMRITPSEPRFISNLLGGAVQPPGAALDGSAFVTGSNGKLARPIDPSNFLGGRMWPYPNIRLANLAIHAVNAADPVVVPELDAAGKAGAVGYFQTLRALEHLRAIETRDTAGAPTDVDIDPLAPPAPLHCKKDVLVFIAALLDTAATNLAAGGSSFPFVLPATFFGFDTPAGFLKFNRALAAKVDVYLAFRDYFDPVTNTVVGTIDPVALDSADADLAASFMVADPSQLDLGPAHDYRTATGDLTNGLFEDTASTAYRANARVRNEADANDQRVARKLAVSKLLSTGSGTTLIASRDIYLLYLTPTTPIKIITNKELLLLQAEVSWGRGNYATALLQAQFIRTSDGGLTTDTTTAAAAGVLNRILYEKRYSLLWEGASRWIDARMFGKLNGFDPPVGVGQERGRNPVFGFPIPFNEQVARNNDLSRTCAP
ncbi:MAG TPA: hypothetical protein VEM13_01115 [Gemmatimonadales bacterium]|nr:hypothetical protein [Gemmatimonadales bacterium]